MTPMTRSAGLHNSYQPSLCLPCPVLAPGENTGSTQEKTSSQANGWYSSNYALLNLLPEFISPEFPPRGLTETTVTTSLGFISMSDGKHEPRDSGAPRASDRSAVQ